MHSLFACNEPCVRGLAQPGQSVGPAAARARSPIRIRALARVPSPRGRPHAAVDGQEKVHVLVGNWLSALNGSRDLGPQAARVLRFLGREPQLAAYASAREIAERAGVNTSTVVRTAQQLGFEGWPALRHHLRSHYIASSPAVR
ncbi:MurR/RpiR family transcriptional regulator [Streptomyces sp. NPDC057301]|uniref:MurR/RpiR family transcriptional regulator n=1 Tax=Streptomyces sp. NPDC057301 TaxID=3346093 RepID=UPI003631393B